MQQQYAVEQGLLGKLSPGEKKLEGKTFYLDNVKKRATALLLEAVSLQGGRIESFLHKDVTFVVTGSQESVKEERRVVVKGAAQGTSEDARHPTKQRESVLTSEKRHPGTPRPMACGSRGKALLEKAIRNNERLQGSSVLANARSWGVKILYVEDVLFYLKQLTRESFNVKPKKSDKAYTKQQGSHVIKAAALRSPYLKIEDTSRRYRPLHMQSMTFPSLCYSGRFSPFESPPPLFEKQTEQGGNKTREKRKLESSIQDNSQTPLICNPSPWRQRKKDTSYCECCHQPFTNLEEHLQSDQHRAFVLDPANYTVLDQLVVEMLPGFDPNPSEAEETLNGPPTPRKIQDVCELEPLTDVETERAVQALRKQSSSFNTHISSPTRSPLSTGHPSPIRGVELPVLSPATGPADVQPFTPTKCEFPDVHPRASSPAMPELHVEPQACGSASRWLSPCLHTPCPSPDPYSLPPVLSPQVPYSSYIMQRSSLYSEPPVLSPQPYIVEEPVEGVICETDTAESLSESVSAVTVPVCIPLLPPVAVTNAEEVTGSVRGSLLGFGGIVCPSSGLECDKLVSHRSRSLPRPTPTAANPKKRCRSASPERSRRKRRRLSCILNERGHKSAKPESDNMAEPKDWLLFDMASFQTREDCTHRKVFPTCTVEPFSVKPGFSTFCVPALQNCTWAPGQTSVLGHGSPSAAAAPAKAKTPDRSLQVSSDKSHGTFFSQDSQRSLSHSTSVCIESALIPDLAALSPSSSDSDWDCALLSRLGPASAAAPAPAEQGCELDKDLLHRPCAWTHDTSYESRLHTALQASTPATSLCGEEMDPSAFSRTVVPIVEVQH